MTTQTQQNTVTFTLDGKSITVPKGTTVYTAAKQVGIDIPIFCYLDRMPPFGACRMCLVENEKIGKLQASCTLEATDGMVINTQSKMAVDGREGILELLLINHPLDCPICDKGGECPLQDNAYAHGPGKSHFFEEKRRFKKPWSLGPVLMLDRERCIVCARCTRFGELVAGDHALEFIERGFKTEVGTPDGGPAASKFIGNTISICPVGALTSDVYRFRARPWDNDSTNTTCTLCSVGCSMILDSRDGEIMRTRALENKEVNDMWLCDKGWFGYEFAYDAFRLQTPLVRHSGELRPSTWEEALSFIAAKIKEFKPNGKLAGFGGTPLLTEDLYLFQKFMRECIGSPHVDYRVGQPVFSLDEETLSPGMEISFADSEDLSFAVLFGMDITEEFPLLWLRLKQAINKGAKVFYFGHLAPEVTQHLTTTFLHAPGEEIVTINKHLNQFSQLLDSKQKGAFFVGKQYLNSLDRKSILSEIAKLKKQHPHISLNVMDAVEGSMGARFAGMHPQLAPFGEPAQNPGMNSNQVLEETLKTGWDFLYVAAANPVRKYPTSFWNQVRSKLKFLVVQDLFLTETAKQADVVLPTLSFIEKEGTFINVEGRIQRTLPGKTLPEEIFSDGDIFKLIAQKLRFDLILDSQFIERINSNKIPLSNSTHTTTPEKQKSSSELKATFLPYLFDKGERMKRNVHLVQLVKEPKFLIHPEEAKAKEIKDNSIVQVKMNGNKIKGKIGFDKRIAMKTLTIPLGFEEIPANELGLNLLNGEEVEVRSSD